MNAPVYDQGPGTGVSPARPRNGFGIAALVLGLLALVLCWTIIGGVLLGLLALIFGLIGGARVRRGQATNGGMSVAGIVLGVLGLLLGIGLAVFGVSLLNSPAGHDYRQCIQQAGSDGGKLEQCLTEFGSKVKGR
ncbi:MAG TPA: hypothetical protein VGL88_03090 [Pseudonocardiaceae bacterium]|jgi:hypothetical protein